MATCEFDSSYAPCGFVIVPAGGSMYDDTGTVLIQSDWDFPGVASAMGWVPCDQCEETDGTVDCEHKDKSQMISEAYDFIEEHAGEEFPALDDYLVAAE